MKTAKYLPGPNCGVWQRLRGYDLKTLSQLNALIAQPPLCAFRRRPLLLAQAFAWVAVLRPRLRARA